MLGLSDQEFKITVINTLRALMDKLVYKNRYTSREKKIQEITKKKKMLVIKQKTNKHYNGKEECLQWVH